MKSILLILISCLLSVSLSAQITFETETEVRYHGDADQVTIDVRNYLTNHASKQVVLIWNKTVSEDTPEEWRTLVCMGQLCFGDNVYENQISIPGGETTEVKVQFEANDILGAGDLFLSLYAPADSAAVNAQCRFLATAFPTGIEDEEETSITIYPNPVINQLTIESSQIDQVEEVEIYSLLGNQVGSYGFKEFVNSSIDVAHLQQGVYFMRFVGKMGNVITTKRFDKL